MNVQSFVDRDSFRCWLKNNYLTSDEVWLVFPKLNIKETSIDYNDAVEEALCFGWIDGICKKYDENHSIRRFSKRNKKSSYSRVNIERLIWLNDHGLIYEDIQKDILPIINKPFIYPLDIIEKLKENDAYGNFVIFSDSYKRIRIAYIMEAKNDFSEYNRRLDTFIKKTKENKLIKGYFGGIDKYYR